MIAKHKRGSTYTSRMRAVYGTVPSLDVIRLVWAEVTITPTLGTHRMARRLGVPLSSVSAAMRILRVAGYIDYADNTTCARKIITPFYVDHRIRIRRVRRLAGAA